MFWFIWTVLDSEFDGNARCKDLGKLFGHLGLQAVSISVLGGCDSVAVDHLIVVQNCLESEKCFVKAERDAIYLRLSIFSALIGHPYVFRAWKC